MQAITIDGTVVEFDEFQVGERGLTLEQRPHSKGSGQHKQSGKQQQSGHSKPAEQAMKQAEEPAQKITREELRETFQEGSGASQRGNGGGGSKSSKSRTIGFIPYHNLEYVVPEETVHHGA